MTTGENQRAGEQEPVVSQPWPTPGWLDQARKTRDASDKSYDEHMVHQLRTKYLNLENDYRLTTSDPNRHPGNDWLYRAYRERTADLLHTARAQLERENPDRFNASSTLNLIERNMVWLYDQQYLDPQTRVVLSRLESSAVNGKEKLIEHLSEAGKQVFGPVETADAAEAGDGTGNQGQPTGDDAVSNLRAALDEAKAVLGDQSLQTQINTRLRLRRLRSLRTWGLIVLGALLLISPVTTDLSGLQDWPDRDLLGTSGALTSFIDFLGIGTGVLASWVNVLGVTLVGASGGYLSGLFKARSDEIAFAMHEEYVAKLTLKPLVGALAALILYVFLSWELIPGVDIQNAGSYFLIAFLAGFSERVFLGLIDRTGGQLPAEESNQDERPGSTEAPR